MPRLSIVIPALGDLVRLEETLVSVLENRPDDCQIVVVLNEPYDDPYDLSGEVDFVHAPPGANLVASVNMGICDSVAPIVHVLSAAVQVRAGWVDWALPCFDDPAVAAVVPLVLETERRDRTVSAGMAYHPAGRVQRLGQGASTAEVSTLGQKLCGPDLVAAFYRKAALKLVGLFDHLLGDRVAAVDMALNFRQAGLRCVLQPQCQTFVDRPTTAAGSRNQFQHGRQMERLFWRWAAEVGWIRSLVCHSWLLGGECLQCVVRPTMLVRLLGRALGAVSVSLHWHYRRLIAKRAAPDSEYATLPSFDARCKCRLKRAG